MPRYRRICFSVRPQIGCRLKLLAAKLGLSEAATLEQLIDEKSDEHGLPTFSRQEATRMVEANRKARPQRPAHDGSGIFTF